MLKKKSKAEPMLSNNPDTADKTGFLHGARAVITKVRAILFGYPDKNGISKTNDDGSPVQAPGLMVTFTVKGAEAPYEQFYANGPSDQRLPVQGGKGFKAAPGAVIKSSLVEGSNAYLLIASLKGAGWPSDALTGDYTVFEGAEVDLIAQPVGNSKKAQAEGQKPRTIAVVGNIVKFPAGVGPDDADEDEEEADDEVEETEDDEEEEEAAPALKAKVKAKAKPAPAEEDEDEEEEEVEAEDEEESDDEEAADPLTESAQEYVASVLTSKKYSGKSITLDLLSKEVLTAAREDKNRKKIVALVQDPSFHASAPWSFNKKTKTVSE